MLPIKMIYRKCNNQLFQMQRSSIKITPRPRPRHGSRWSCLPWWSLLSTHQPPASHRLTLDAGRRPQRLRVSEKTTFPEVKPSPSNRTMGSHWYRLALSCTHEVLTHRHTSAPKIIYGLLPILFLSHTFQREGESLLKVSCPNLRSLQFGLLSLFFFCLILILERPDFKSSALL